jgi:hypothetical protein
VESLRPVVSVKPSNVDATPWVEPRVGIGSRRAPVTSRSGGSETLFRDSFQSPWEIRDAIRPPCGSPAIGCVPESPPQQTTPSPNHPGRVVEPRPQRSQQPLGGASSSCGYRSVRNLGSGAVTIVGFFPGDPGWCSGRPGKRQGRAGTCRGSVAMNRRYFQTCTARAFRERFFGRKSKVNPFFTACSTCSPRVGGHKTGYAATSGPD